MIVAIADTHTTIWYLYSDSRLGKAASGFIETTIARGDHIGVSAISIAEMIYLVEKGRIPAHALRDLQAAIANPKAVLRYVPLDEHVAMKMTEIPPPEPPRPSRPGNCRNGVILLHTCIEPRRTDSRIGYQNHLVITATDVPAPSS